MTNDPDERLLPPMQRLEVECPIVGDSIYPSHVATLTVWLLTPNIVTHDGRLPIVWANDFAQN